jgi:hypothetical protein
MSDTIPLIMKQSLNPIIQYEEELRVFKNFIVTRPILTDFAIIPKADEHLSLPPDVILKVPERKVGIEITELMLDEAPHGSRLKQLESETDQIIHLARKKFEERCSLKVNVRIHWVHDIANSGFKKRKEKIATNIAIAVEEFAKPGHFVLIEWRDLWPNPVGKRDPAKGLPELDSIVISCSLGFTTSNWFEDGGGTFGPVPTSSIRKRIEEKDKRYQKARELCDQCYLLIYTAGNRRSSFNLFEETKKLLSTEIFETPYDRIFYFDQFSRESVELQILPSTQLVN